MSLPIYQRVAVTDAGDVIPGAEYTVINENTGVAAPIYSDRTGATLLTPPYFADSVGTIQFFIAQGTTFRVAASGGVGTYTDRYVYGVAEAVLVQADGTVNIGGLGSNDGNIALKRSSDNLTVGNVTVDSVGSRFVMGTAYSNIDFFTEQTNFGMRIKNGNVGIGNSDPTAPLDVRKAAGGNFIANFQNTTASTPYGVSIKDAVGGANGYPLFQVTNSAGSVAHLKVMSGTGDVIVGSGVVFDAAGGTGTNTSNTLDSYEEGLWTPTGAGVSPVYNCFYTKIGNKVHCKGYFNTTASVSIVGGLPFTFFGGTGSRSIGTTGFNNFTSSVMSLLHTGSGTSFSFYVGGTGQSITTGKIVYFDLTYFTSD